MMQPFEIIHHLRTQIDAHRLLLARVRVLQLFQLGKVIFLLHKITASSRFLESDFSRVAQRVENTQQKISRNILSITVEDRRHARTRGASQPSDLRVS
jgi:hypothetical protein